MNSSDAFVKFRDEIDRRSSEITKLFDVSNYAIMIKHIAINGLHKFGEDYRITDANGVTLINEKTLNQIIEFTIQYMTEAMNTEDPKYKAAFIQGYERARIEFAKATGLYTEQIEDGEY